MNTFTKTFLLTVGLLGLPASSGAGWRTLDTGLDLGEFRSTLRTVAGDSMVVVLRIDPAVWKLRVLCAGVAGAAGVSGNLTAKQWCQREGLSAAINAGMFSSDYHAHIGYLRSGKHINCPSSNQYRSVAAFCPRREGIPRFRIFDLDQPGGSIAALNADYDCVVQNLRLIKRPSLNCWSPQENRWSEAALGEDTQGRVLFVFSRSPYSMHDFNVVLTGLPIGLECAQHLEGGPEAQLYLRTAAFELEVVGSYETGFRQDDSNQSAWPIPNVLGIVRRVVPDSR